MAINKDNSSNKQKKPKRFWKIFGRTFLFLVLVFCCVSGFLVGKAYTWIAEAKQEFPLDGQLQVSSLTSYIYDSNGKKIDQLTGGEDRDWVDINKIPDFVKKSFIAIEDERFYKHNGIDVYRIFGALWSDIKSGHLRQGGSTITQQYVKTAILNNDTKKFKRKIQEQYLAIQLEKQYTKDQILQSYLNTINLGHGAYGIGAAAKIYFGKTSLKDLTIAEAATIASMPQAPANLDPYYYFDANQERQRLVLKKMLDLKFITKSQYDTALKEDIKSELHKLVVTKTKHVHSYFVEAVIKEVRQKLKEKGMNPNLVYTGGYRIYTTLDQSIQDKLDTTFNQKGLFPTLGVNNGFVQPQASMVILDYHTGEVKALIGGRGQKTANLTFNRAVDSYRQPGSSIKPLAVYGPAIDALGLNEYSTVVDSPFSIGTYTPHNDYSGYYGSMSYKQALTISANIPAVKVFQTVGVNTSFRYLTEKFKITSIDDKRDKYSASSMALGGLTKGVTVLDMTTAYGIIANKGVYVPAHTFTKVVDSNGTVVIDNTPTAEREISEDTAAQLTDMMQNVILHGTAMNAIFKNISMPEAGKTGTTTSTKDKWFVGYTPYYAAGVWMGFDNPTPMNIGTNYSAVAWKAVMENIHTNLPAINFFDIPAGIHPAKIKMKKKHIEKEYVQVEICSESGLKAGQWCPPEDIREKTFESGTEPQEYCNIHGPNDTSSTSSQNNSNDTGGQVLDNSSASDSNSDNNSSNDNSSSDNSGSSVNNSNGNNVIVNNGSNNDSNSSNNDNGNNNTGSSNSDNIDNSSSSADNTDNSPAQSKPTPQVNNKNLTQKQNTNSTSESVSQ